MAVDGFFLFLTCFHIIFERVKLSLENVWVFHLLTAVIHNHCFLSVKLIWHRNYRMIKDELFLYLLYVRKFIMKSISPEIWSSRVQYRYNTITALFFCHFSWFVLYKLNWTVVNKIDLMVCICCILSSLNLKITSGNLDLGVGVFVVCVRVSLYILLLTQ